MTGINTDSSVDVRMKHDQPSVCCLRTANGVKFAARHALAVWGRKTPIGYSVRLPAGSTRGQMRLVRRKLRSQSNRLFGRPSRLQPIGKLIMADTIKEFFQELVDRGHQPLL